MSFEIGDVVVCVDASVRHDSPRAALALALEEGNRYTIRWTGIASNKSGAGCSVMLSEVILPPISPGHLEPAFNADRFRKLTGPCELQRVEAMRKEPVRA